VVGWHRRLDRRSGRSIIVRELLVGGMDSPEATLLRGTKETLHHDPGCVWGGEKKSLGKKTKTVLLRNCGSEFPQGRGSVTHSETTEHLLREGEVGKT